MVAVVHKIMRLKTRIWGFKIHALKAGTIKFRLDIRIIFRNEGTRSWLA